MCFLLYFLKKLFDILCANSDEESLVVFALKHLEEGRAFEFKFCPCEELYDAFLDEPISEQFCLVFLLDLILDIFALHFVLQFNDQS
jgi:hypothetical protein